MNQRSQKSRNMTHNILSSDDKNLKLEFDKLIREVSVDVMTSSVSQSIKQAADTIYKTAPELSQITKNLSKESNELTKVTRNLKGIDFKTMSQEIKRMERKIQSLAETQQTLFDNQQMLFDSLENEGKILAQLIKSNDSSMKAAMISEFFEMQVKLKSLFQTLVEEKQSNLIPIGIIIFLLVLNLFF